MVDRRRYMSKRLPPPPPLLLLLLLLMALLVLVTVPAAIPALLFSADNGPARARGVWSLAVVPGLLVAVAVVVAVIAAAAEIEVVAVVVVVVVPAPVPVPVPAPAPAPTPTPCRRSWACCLLRRNARSNSPGDMVRAVASTFSRKFTVCVFVRANLGVCMFVSGSEALQMRESVEM